MTNEWKSRICMWLDTLKDSFYTPVQSLDFTYFTTNMHLTPEEAAVHSFSPAGEGMHWGSEWEYGWFSTKAVLGSWAAGKRVVLDLNLGGEATLFVNGKCFGTRRDDWILERHHFMCDNTITREGAAGDEYEILAECYGGHQRPPERGECASGPFPGGARWKREDRKTMRILGISTVGVWNEEAYHLWLEARLLYDIWRNEPEESLRAGELEQALRGFTKRLDFEQCADDFEENVKDCRLFLRPYLQCKNGSTAPVMHAIGHAHIDLEWLWPIEETQRKCARTMAAQLRHMDEYPEYRMLLSQPYLYEVIRQLYPGLFEKIKEKIRNGQLISEGGMWVESDVNLPSGESLVRQFLYGKKYFKEELGCDSRLLWLPDVFGYSAALPQIMKKCGIDRFSTHKIFWTYNGGEPFPYHYFDWKGIDGTSVPTFIHVEYSSATDADTVIKRWRNRAQKQGIRRFLFPFGYGDGGGGASRDHIENCLLLKDVEGAPRVRFDDPGHFFDVIASDYETRPEYVGELYYQAHRGTYTSQARTKKGNRNCEFALRETEMAAALASVTVPKDGAGMQPYVQSYVQTYVQTDYAYPKEELEELWKRVLLNQFHDILPGSSIHKVYERVERDYAEILDELSGIRERAIGAVIQPGEGISLFNSLSWERRACVPIPDSWDNVYDARGKEVLIQLGRQGRFAEVMLPPCGMNMILGGKKEAEGSDAVKEEAGCEAADTECGRLEVLHTECHGLEASDTECRAFEEDGVFGLENVCLRVLLNSAGEAASIYDKEYRSEWASGPCGHLAMYQDIPGHFEAWDIDSIYREVPVPISGEARISIGENGPIYSSLLVERTLGQSEMLQEIRLYHDSRRVEFRTKIDWRETHRLLKAEFPVNIRTEELVSEIQFGYVKRPNHASRNYDRDRFEVCNHKWSALKEENRGCAVINDSKYGISASGSTMGLTLLKSATFPDESADMGLQEFTYAFYCWNGSFMSGRVVQEAYELNVPVTAAAGRCRWRSWFELDTEHVIIETVKRAEDGQGVVLRLYECMGTTVSCALQTSLPVERAALSDMLEREEQELPLEEGGRRIKLAFTPFEVKTVIIRLLP